MAGSRCPNCGRQTFFLSEKGRKCSKCDYEMTVPINNGKGGKGKLCPNCHKFTIQKNKCTNCGATFGMPSQKKMPPQKKR
jgi:rRNA maturation protein Nop10